MKKIIILVLVFLALVGGITYVVFSDVAIGTVGTLSIESIGSKKLMLENEEKKYDSNQSSFTAKETTLDKVTKEYNEQKNKYNSITDTTLNLVKESLKSVDYSLEYMWIILGNYAYNNGLSIRIEEADNSSSTKNDSTEQSSKSYNTIDQQNSVDLGSDNNSDDVVEENKLDDVSDSTTTTTTNSTLKNSIVDNSQSANSSTNNSTNTSVNKVLKLTVVGRYSDVADFVFEVENDKSLRFKLDNISMKYSSDNKITATFDVYGLTITK